MIAMSDAFRLFGSYRTEKFTTSMFNPNPTLLYYHQRVVYFGLLTSNVPTRAASINQLRFNSHKLRMKIFLAVFASVLVAGE